MTELARLADSLKKQSTKLTTTCMQWFFASLRDLFDEGKEAIDIHIVIGLLDQVTDDVLELERRVRKGVRKMSKDCLERDLRNTAFILELQAKSWVLALEENNARSIRKDLVIVLLDRLIEEIEEINVLAKEISPDDEED